MFDRDRWLMSQVADGQADALEPLLRRHANSLLTFIRRMIGDHHRSEDLFQEVFVAVWKNRGRYHRELPFRPWLFAIALNACRAEYRRRKPYASWGDADCTTLEDPDTDPPADAALSAERATLVLDALDRLPLRQRSVVALRIWSGLSFLEIAGVMECSEGTARAHMHQALAALREHLEPSFREYDRSHKERQP